MPRLFTTATLRTRIRQRADIENDSHVSDSELNGLMSEVYGELSSEVSAVLNRYFETSTIVTATGATSYNEPSDHYALIRIARVDSSGREFDLEQLRSQDEAHFKGLTGSDARGFTLIDDQLRLYPNPSSGSYKWYYLPQPPDLSSYADGDNIDVVCPAGEAFLIWGVAAIALGKAESNASFALSKQEQAREQLQFWASQRNLVTGPSRGGSGDGGPSGLPGDWEGWSG